MSVVGAGAFARGRQYANSGRVRQVVASVDGRTLVGSVRGSGGRSYTTTVRLGTLPGEPAFAGHCTCPMLADCKHVVAVLLAGAPRPAGPTVVSLFDPPEGPARPPRWEEILTPVVRSGAVPERVVGRLPLALQVTHELPRPNSWDRTPAPRTYVRPLIEGKSGRWIRTGASWSDIANAMPTADEQHVAAVRDFYRRATTKSGSYYEYSRPDLLQLEIMSAAGWAGLAEAVAAGVVLVGAEPGDLVDFGESLEAVLDLHRTADGIQVNPRFRFPDGTLAPDDITLIGIPAHGWVRRRLGGPGTPRRLTIGALSVPMTREIEALFRAEPLVIPAADEDRFVDGFVPTLRRLTVLTSTDDSVDLPEPVPPRLALRVAFGADHVVELAWSFHYGRAERPVPVPLTGPTGAARDADAERDLLDRLAAVPGAPREWWRGNGRAALPAAQRYTGLATARFAGELLPHLQAQDWLDVEIAGELPAYRFVPDAPVVELALTDADAGAGRPTTAASGGTGTDNTLWGNDWFDLGIAVSVGGEAVPFEHLFLALARGEDHLLLDTGTWFPLDRPEYATLRRLIEEARALQDRPQAGGPLRLTAYQAGLWEELVELGVVAAQSTRWERTVGALLGTTDIPVPPVPEGISATLRPYQRDGFGWLAALWGLGLGGILADDMGLGKTLQVLALVQHAKDAGDLTDPVLIVAPTSVLATWSGEAARFAPGLRVVTIGETTTRRRVPLVEAVAGADIVVTSYAITRLDAEEFLARPWRAVVLDEAQFVKNHQAKTYATVRRLAAPVKFALTGTPLENTLMDLWSLLSVVAPGVFPNPQRFAEIYRRPIESGSAPDVLDSLRRRIRPLVLRRTKESVATELPPKQEQTLTIELAPAHRKLYDTHLQRERQRVLRLIDDFDANRILILKSLTTLRLMALHPGLADPTYAGTVTSAKVDELVDQLVELHAEGHRALVFSQFTRFLAMIRERLEAAGLAYAYLDGRTRNRAAKVASFREGDAPVFLISLKAGGFGLTLTEADYVYVMDPWWNPAAEAQAVDRTHRIGQTRTVMVYRMIAGGTIEEKVAALQQRKRDLFAQVVDGGALDGGALTAADIRDLLGMP